jgi:hypothetical protein
MASTPFECKYQIVSATPLVFVNVSEDLIMVDDVATPSNLTIVPVEEEELEEVSLDMNVSQWLHKEELSKRMVCTQVDRSTWDCQLFFNPHALVIYLKFVPACGVVPKRFEKCQCEDDNVCLHCRTWVLDDDHSHWLRDLINPLSMEHRTEYLARTIRCILDFLYF